MEILFFLMTCLIIASVGMALMSYGDNHRDSMNGRVVGFVGVMLVSVGLVFICSIQ